MVTGTRKFFKFKSPIISETKGKIEIIYEEKVIDKLNKGDASKETLEEYKNKIRFIQNDPRKYLIENGLLSYRTGQTVLFCHSDVPDTEHTLSNSVYIITCIHKNSKDVPFSADIVGYYGNVVTYEGVNIADLEPF